MKFQGDKVVVTLEEEEVVSKKIEEIEEERVEFNTHTHTKQMSKQLYSDRDFLFWHFLIFFGLIIQAYADLGSPWPFSSIVKLFVYPLVFVVCFIIERDYLE